MRQNHQLTDKQSRFAALRAQGKTLKECWIGAGYKTVGSDKLDTQKGSNLSRHPKVAAEIDRIKKEYGLNPVEQILQIQPKPIEIPSSNVMSVEEYRTILAMIARDPNASDATRLKALETDAKLTGIFGKVLDKEAEKEEDDIPKPGSKAWSLRLNAALQAANQIEDNKD